MSKLQVIGIYVGDRKQEALDVQNILTNYGCSIKTRIGLHEVSEEFCSSCGLILIELTGNQTERDNLIAALEAIGNIQVKRMEFDA